MDFEMELKELPPQPMLSIRARVAHDNHEDFFGNTRGMLFPYLEALGSYPAGPPVTLYVGQVNGEGAELEFCVPTETLLSEEGEITAGELPGGEFASTLHIGPYERIGRAYAELLIWIFENGYHLSGPSREVHLACLHRRSEPAEHITEILFPVRKAA